VNVEFSQHDAIPLFRNHHWKAGLATPNRIPKRRETSNGNGSEDTPLMGRAQEFWGKTLQTCGGLAEV
jgi:hypothetical protein